MVREVFTLTFLGVNAWLDIKKKEISLLTVGFFAAGGALWSVWSGRTVIQAAIPLGTVLVFLALCFITDGGVGPGDVWMLLALGLMLKTEEFLTMLCIGMLLSGIWALILLTMVRKGRHTPIPFVPFLLAGYVGGLFL